MLGQLSNICSVSGNEKEIRAFIKKNIGEYADTYVDSMGNLYVHKQGKGKRVMVCAHMDEVGMMVKYITEEGHLLYDSCGIDSRVCVSKRVFVGDKKVPGVIGTKAIHLTTREEREKSIPHSELYVDIGATSREDALKYVSPGDYICFDTEYEEFGEGMVKGKALDDRVGCQIVLELLKNNYNCDFYGVFTVQEEVGDRGAQAAAYQVQPDLAIVFEGTAANDMPGVERNLSSTRVGEGPAISMMDRATIVNPKLLKAMMKTGDEYGIPYQLRQGTNGGTDAGAIHTACEGALAIGISVPCRYIHGPVALAKKSDIENSILLADTFLKLRKFEEVL